MSEYLKSKELKNIPRIPLEGEIDLTYHCNNNCRHCWLRIPQDSREREKELSFEEIRNIVDEARKMGCREWSISGGEPMLRPDFSEIFDYIASKSLSYSLNTNGTLITPRIASLMKKKGSKRIALYGATADVHDNITRNPGSFEATMQGFAYLKEAGVGFVVQLMPMRDNYHQFKDMVRVAESLSPHWKIGAAWLYLSACGSPERNREITRQRLEPRDLVELDKSDLSSEERLENEEDHKYHQSKKDGYFFGSCIPKRRNFHIDPYGQMTFCGFIRDPVLRYDLRKGSFNECWEKFIPSLAEKVKPKNEYQENCGSCKFVEDCHWCPAYGYLEHRRFSAKVEYLCAVAKENKKFREDWQKNHRRYYQIADITIQMDSDLPITDSTFHPKFKLFEVNSPGEDTITIRHHFSLPDLKGHDLGKEVYRKPPWAIYKRNGSWIYVGTTRVNEDEIFNRYTRDEIIYDNQHIYYIDIRDGSYIYLGTSCAKEEDEDIRRVAVFNHDYTRAEIYNDNEEIFLQGGVESLTLFPSDQILLAHVLADRQGCFLHASGVILEGQGLLFVGHSKAGKSTVAKILADRAKILCDDRMIVRGYRDEFKIYGNWSHGEVSEVSPDSASLKAILFLEKARENRLIPIKDKKEKIRKLLACLIKPFLTADWWDKMLPLLGRIVSEVPCYSFHFNKSGKVTDFLIRL